MEKNKERKVYEYAKDYSNKDVAKEIAKEAGRPLINLAWDLVEIWLNSKKR